MTAVMTITPTWDYAAEQIVHQFDRYTRPGPIDLRVLRFDRDAMAADVRDRNDPSPLLFWSVGAEACGELMDMELWDVDEFVELLVSKQHDYGHDNINMFGIPGVAVRLCDKIARFLNLTSQAHEAANEPLVDTLRDMVGYAVLAEMLTNNTFDLHLSSDSSKWLWRGAGS